MVNPRKIRYEFLQYTDNFKNPFINKIERSMNDSAKKKKKRKNKNSGAQTVRTPSLPQKFEYPQASPREIESLADEIP